MRNECSLSLSTHTIHSIYFSIYSKKTKSTLSNMKESVNFELLINMFLSISSCVFKYSYKIVLNENGILLTHKASWRFYGSLFSHSLAIF